MNVSTDIFATAPFWPDTSERVCRVFEVDYRTIAEPEFQLQIAIPWRTYGTGDAVAPAPPTGAKVKVRHGGSGVHRSDDRAVALPPTLVTGDAIDGAVISEVEIGGAGGYIGAYVPSAETPGPGEFLYVPPEWPGYHEATITIGNPGILTELIVTIEGLDAEVATFQGLFSATWTTLAEELPVMPTIPRLHWGPGPRGGARSSLGVDLDSVFDITPHFKLVEGLPNLGRALARRLSTPRGALSYDLDYGLDLRQYLHADVTSAAVANLAAAVAAECEKDRRVRQARVALAYDPALRRLRVTVRGTSVEGPFELILSANDNAITIDSIGRLGSL